MLIIPKNVEIVNTIIKTLKIKFVVIWDELYKSLLHEKNLVAKMLVLNGQNLYNNFITYRNLRFV